MTSQGPADGRRLILASASPRRRALLADLVADFDVRPTDADESLPAGLEPEAAAQVLALRKAKAVGAAAGDLVIGSDTLVVADDGEVFGKPRDADDARRILGKLSGTTHRVITGIALVRGDPPHETTDAVTTEITMRALDPAEIDDYVASGECFGKAGAYAIQETGDRFVTSVRGSWTNVVGLPLERLTERLRDAGMTAEPAS